MSHPDSLRIDFDHLTSISERDHHIANVEANDRFVAAMARAVIRKKEKVTAGTFKDFSPMTPAALRLGRADLLHSPVGSPAAMCASN